MNSIAAAFVAARRSATPLQAFPGELPDAAALAYHCQDAAIGLWPDVIAGWKVARIAADWPPACDGRFPEPRLVGPIFQRNVHLAMHGQAPHCAVFAGGFAAVEAEIVIRLARDAPADQQAWTLPEALAMVDTVHIGIEIASSPLATLNDLGAGAVICDFGNNHGVVVGPAIDAWHNITGVDCETCIDDVSIAARSVTMEQGPFAALAFALTHCAARGRPLRAGAWISTGMITGVHDIRAGQRSRHAFGPHGEVGCRIVRAAPLP